MDSLFRMMALTMKELLAVLKDPKSRISLFMPPLVQCLLYGYAASYDLNHVPYAVLDRDHSIASHQLTSKLDGSGVFQRVSDLARQEDAAKLLNESKALLILQIDQDFERRLLLGQTASIQLIADGRNSNTASTATGYVTSIVEQFNSDWRIEHNQAAPQLMIESRAWYNANFETRWHMVREQGTFDQLLITPYEAHEIMVGKAMPSILIGLSQATLVVFVAQLWFHIPFQGSYLTLYTGLVVFVMAAVGIGLLVSAVSSTMQQAMLYNFLILMPFMLLSGFTTPISNMPKVLQSFTWINPLRHAITLVLRVYLEGATLTMVWPYILPLLMIAVVTLSGAAYLFRYRLG